MQKPEHLPSRGSHRLWWNGNIIFVINFSHICSRCDTELWLHILVWWS